MTSRIAHTLSLLVALLVVSFAHADDSRMMKQLHDYAAKNNLPVRKVMAPGSGKPVERLFAPVLPNTYDDLRSRLSEGNGGISVRALSQAGDPYGHVTIGIEPGSAYLWGKNDPNRRQQYMSYQSGGYLFGVDLADAEIKHFKTQIATIPHNPSNCMMWLAEAQIAPGKLLFHEMGMSRSKGAGNSIRAKLLRVSNDRLRVAGVMVNSVEEFNAMTDAQLLGPPTANGDAEAAHQ